MIEEAPDRRQRRLRGHRRRLTIGMGGLILVALLLGAIISNAIGSAQARREATAWQVHTFDVLFTTEKLKAAVHAALRGERGYLLTRDDRFLAPWEEGRRSVPTLIAQLEGLTVDNALQQRRLAALEVRSHRYLAVLSQTIALERAGREAEALAIVRAGLGKREIDALLGQIARIEAAELTMLADRSRAAAEADEASRDWGMALVIVALAILGITGAAAIAAARAYRVAGALSEQLEHIAATDELTGLHNRRAFLMLLDQELARADRTGRPLATAIIDVDHFKRVNDTHGHQGGDEVLRAVAIVARATMRRGDIVGRIGGEEFAVLMPDTNAAEAERACERLRSAVAARATAMPGGGEARVTLSAGVSLREAADSRDALIARADAALYRAKESGRDRVLMAA